MNSPDWEVLTRATEWLDAGYRVHLFTLVQTWGSAPRLPGAVLAVRNDGHYIGSVSGGCIEDDLADKARGNRLPVEVSLIEYGISRDEAQRFGIPCGGRLQILAEPLQSSDQLAPVIEGMEQRRLIRRSVKLGSGETRFSEALPGSTASLEGEWFHGYFGPRWRLLIIGANQLGAVLASMAQTLEFDVMICDPREDIRAEWRVAGTKWMHGMPDDVVQAMAPDAHTAIVAVTHDPKLDDMALLEALKCEAFYVGALGSRRNQENRRERMRMFDLSEAEIGRLHGPVGLNIGSRTPSEIAIAILAEIIQTRTRQRLAATESRSYTQQSCFSG
ncbi:Molybdenum cofactor insertion chaperone PaoD [Methylophilaceae bacterium]|nr:Molybdenum cofactor insertion chaperone PaoD [Methylophilaceae bacterium]